MIRTWALAPLAISALCFLWVWIANRRPRLAGLVWPHGVELAGTLARPDLSYAGDIVLGAEGRFGTLQCRTLVIARGAEISAERVVALRVRVDGKLAVSDVLSAAKRLEVRGELRAEEVQAPRIVLRAGSRTTAITAAGRPRIDRHPRALVKGFFDDRAEMSVSQTRASAKPLDTTDKISIVR